MLIIEHVGSPVPTSVHHEGGAEVEDLVGDRHRLVEHVACGIDADVGGVAFHQARAVDPSVDGEVGCIVSASGVVVCPVTGVVNCKPGAVAVEGFPRHGGGVVPGYFHREGVVAFRLTGQGR